MRMVKIIKVKDNGLVKKIVISFLEIKRDCLKFVSIILPRTTARTKGVSGKSNSVLQHFTRTIRKNVKKN